jgi:hypothetical protein
MLRRGVGRNVPRGEGGSKKVDKGGGDVARERECVERGREPGCVLGGGGSQGECWRRRQS